MHKSEKEFAEFLKSQGKTYVYQPEKFKLKDTTYRTDFYCPEDDTFYEVVGADQAFYHNGKKILEFMKEYPEIKFELVKPNGEKFIINKGKKMKKKIPLMVELSDELYTRLSDYCEQHGQQTKASVVRYALEVFLKKDKEKR